MNARRLFIGFLAALPLAAGLFNTPTPAQAASSDCTILPSDLSAVTEAQAQGFAAELAARRALLTKTITCAKANAQALTDQLNALSIGTDAAPIRDQFMSKLNDVETYYDLELGKVNGAGISGTQAIAREVLSWRASNFAPLTDQISDFILWASDQTLIATANSRLNQMKNIVAFLEQAGTQTDLEGLLGSASSLVTSANQENDAARTALMQFLPADQSLDLIKQSLSSLADAYAKFSDMSAIIQKLLPTSAK